MRPSKQAPETDRTPHVVPTEGRIVVCAGNITLAVAPECGGALTRFEVRSSRGPLDVLRPAIESKIAARSPYGASCFPMVPYAGRLRHGTFLFGGRRVIFPLNVPWERHSSHGDGWQRPWHVQWLMPDSVSLRLTPSNRDPLRYEAVQLIRVRPESVEIRLEVTNREPDRLPFGLGLHPYFANRAAARLTATVPIRRKLDSELMPTDRYEVADRSHLRAQHPVQDLDVVNVFECWDGSLEIAWPEDGLNLRLRTSPALRHAVIWVPREESFFCFEPVSHATDGFNSPEHAGQIQVVEPGETLAQSFEFSVQLT